MARYIDAVNGADIISEKLNIPLDDLVDVFAEISTADVEEVKHGEWKKVSNAKVYWYVCSVCEEEMPRNKYGGWSFPSFCPDCGAKMDGGKTE